MDEYDKFDYNIRFVDDSIHDGNNRFNEDNKFDYYNRADCNEDRKLVDNNIFNGSNRFNSDSTLDEYCAV